jgi:hypothetical protein
MALYSLMLSSTLHFDECHQLWETLIVELPRRVARSSGEATNLGRCTVKSSCQGGLDL